MAVNFDNPLLERRRGLKSGALLKPRTIHDGVTLPDVFVAEQQTNISSAREHDLELSEKSSEAFVDGIFASIRAGEVDLPKDVPAEMRRRVRTLQEEVKAMSDEELREKLVEDTNALTGGDPDAVPDESNILLRYLLARDAVERITNEKEIADLEKAYKHVKEGINRRVFYRLRLGAVLAQVVNGGTAVVDVPAGTAALLALGGPLTAGVAAAGGAAEVLAGGHSMPVKVGVGVGSAALAGLALWNPAVAAPIIAVGVIGRTGYMKARTQSPADLSPIGIVKKEDGKWKVRPRLKGKGLLYLGVAAAVSTAGGTLLLKTLQNSGAAKEIAEVAKAAADKSIGEVKRTRDEVREAPGQFRAAAHAAYEQALTLGGKGHGLRTARTVQLYFGDAIINKDGTRGDTNRDAYLRDFPNNPGAFDTEIQTVKEEMKKLGLDPARGLLGYIEDQLKLLTLVENATKSDELAALARDKVLYIDIRLAESAAGKLTASAEAIGKVTAYDELMAGWYAAGKEIFHDPKSLHAWIEGIKHIFADHAADISSLEGLDATKQKALLDLSKRLIALTVEADIRAKVIALQNSGISFVAGDKNVTPQVKEESGKLAALRVHEKQLRQSIEKGEGAKKKPQNLDKLRTDLAEIQAQIKAEEAKGGVSAAQGVGGKVDVLAAFKIPQIRFNLTPEMVQTLGIRFEGGLKEVVSQDFFSRLGALMHGMSPELKKYSAKGLENTWIPGVGFIKLDPASSDFDAQINKWLGIAVFTLFFAGPLLVGTANVGNRMWGERIRRKKDETLDTAERSIAKQLLAHIQQREKNILTQLLANGIAPDPAQSNTSVSEESLMDLVRKGIVRELDKGDGTYDTFVLRGGSIQSAPERTAYAARLDEIEKLMQERKFDDVLRVFLPDQVRTEQRIKDKLELLHVNVPEAREGIVSAISSALVQLKDPVRAEMITTLRREMAESGALVALLRTELAKNAGVTQSTVLYEELLRAEIARNEEMSIELGRMTSGTLGKKSVAALDAEVAQVDTDIDIRLADMVADSQLRNEWRSGTGLTLEAATNEIQKFWDSIVVSNAKRLQEACASALKGMPLKGEIALRRVHLPSGEAGIAFESEMIDGTKQTLVFPRAVPSPALQSTEAVVLAIESWFASGSEVSFDVQLAVDAMKQRREELLKTMVELGAKKISNVEVLIPHSVMADPANAEKIKQLFVVSSAHSLQQSILSALSLTKATPTELQTNALRDPVTYGGRAVFNGEVNEYVSADAAVTYRINVETGAIQTQKGSRVIAEDAFFVPR